MGHVPPWCPRGQATGGGAVLLVWLVLATSAVARGSHQLCMFNVYADPLGPVPNLTGSVSVRGAATFAAPLGTGTRYEIDNSHTPCNGQDSFVVRVSSMRNYTITQVSFEADTTLPYTTYGVCQTPSPFCMSEGPLVPLSGYEKIFVNVWALKYLGGTVEFTIALNNSAARLYLRNIVINGTMGCAQLPVPSHGSLSSYYQYPWHGVTVGYSCIVGYRLSGISSRTCIAGAWTGSEPSCDLIPDFCVVPDSIDNGIVGVCAGSIGSTCAYTCLPGYTNTTKLTGRCLSSGDFSNSDAACIPYPGFCLAIAPENGYVGDGCSTTIGGACSFICKTGYQHSETITCGACGTTGCYGDVSCTLIPDFCTYPSPPKFGSITTCATTLGGTCSFDCNPGYAPTGPTTRTCKIDHSFNCSEVYCKPVPNYCPMPAVPDNGMIGACSTTVGGLCTFSCRSGYLASATKRTCMSNAVFSGTPVVCSLDVGFCPLPLPPLNGSRDNCSQSLGGACCFSCDDGYYIDTPVRTCQDYGDFNGTESQCILNDTYCPMPDVPMYASVLDCERSIGGQCAFACDIGYAKTGNAWSCSASGQWVTNNFRCEAIWGWCSAPAPPVHGDIAYCPQTIGSPCYVSCDVGYTPNSGMDAPDCQANHTYNGTVPGCIPVLDYCEQPSSSIGSATLVSYDARLNGVSIFACQAGYTGGGALTCAVDGVFIGPSLMCARVVAFCDVPAPPDNGFVTGCNQYIGGTCDFACNTGYTAVTSLQRYCQDDRTYTDGGTCQALPGFCTMPPQPENGQIDACSTALGGQCNFHCDPGYEPIDAGGLTRTCTLSQQFDDPALQCQLIDLYCDVPVEVPHAVIGECGRTLGDSCVYYCEPGYEPAQFNRTCLASTDFASTDSGCTASPGHCVLPPVPHGAPTDSCNGAIGSTCIFNCDEGYLPAQYALMCGPPGYSQKPTCELLQCNPPHDILPDNAMIHCTGHNYQDYCNITCMPGYTPSGTLDTCCGADGQWTGAHDAECTAVPDSIHSPQTPPPSGGSSTGGLLGAMTAVLFVIFLALVGIGCIVRVTRRKNDLGSTLKLEASSERVAQKRIETMMAAETTQIIGKGSFAIVYKTLFDDEEVAVKVMHKTNKEAVAEFHREVTILSRLGVAGHQNVIGLRFFSQQPPAIVMELAERGSLYAMLRERKCPAHKRLPYALQLASGMKFLHDNMIAHLDIKPENILMGNRDQLKITDFGCAMLLGADITVDERGLCVPTEYMGTPHFSAPERFGTAAYSLFKADVYSFGITVWSMVTGNAPYGAERLEAVIDHLTMSPHTVHRRFLVPRETPQHLSDLIRDCIRPEFLQRPSFAEIDARLREAMQPEPSMDDRHKPNDNPLFKTQPAAEREDEASFSSLDGSSDVSTADDPPVVSHRSGSSGAQVAPVGPSHSRPPSNTRSPRSINPPGEARVRPGSGHASAAVEPSVSRERSRSGGDRQSMGSPPVERRTERVEHAERERSERGAPSERHERPERVERVEQSEAHASARYDRPPLAVPTPHPVTPPTGPPIPARYTAEPARDQGRRKRQRTAVAATMVAPGQSRRSGVGALPSGAIVPEAAAAARLDEVELTEQAVRDSPPRSPR